MKKYLILIITSFLSLGLIGCNSQSKSPLDVTALYPRLNAHFTSSAFTWERSHGVNILVHIQNNRDEDTFIYMGARFLQVFINHQEIPHESFRHPHDIETILDGWGLSGNFFPGEAVTLGVLIGSHRSPITGRNLAIAPGILIEGINSLVVRITYVEIRHKGQWETKTSEEIGNIFQEGREKWNSGNRSYVYSNTMYFTYEVMEQPPGW